MKFKVKVSDEFLKALDIDLHLESPDRKKVAHILRVLNESMMSVLPKDMLKNVTSPISDKTDVKRYDLEGLEKEQKQEIKNTIKYSDRENFFAFFSSKDEILAVIYDYQIIKLSPTLERSSNINDLLKLAYYVLKFNMEDIEENVKLPYSRRSARTSAVAVEREENLIAEQARLNGLFKEFMNLVRSKGFKERQIFSIPAKDKKYDAKKVKLYQLSAGDLFSQDTDGSSILEVVTITPTDTDEWLRLEYKPHGSDKAHSTQLNRDMDFYKLSLKDEADAEDNEYEVIVPKEEDLKTLIERGQGFPKNLFPYRLGEIKSKSGREDFAEKLKSLKSKWDQMVSIVKKDNLDINISSTIDKFKERVSSQNYKGNPNLSYIDKSGYKVNLAKYFSKLLEIPPKVPVAVKEAYEKAFSYIEEESKDLISKLQQAVERSDWYIVRKISAILSDYGTSAFNDSIEAYLKAESYDRNTYNPATKRDALVAIENNLTYFKNEVRDL